MGRRIISHMKDHPLGSHPIWISTFFGIDIAGLAVFLFGMHPDWFGFDRSHVIGYLHVILFLFGLTLIVLSTYALLRLRRPHGQAVTLREEIGIRLAATGYVFSVLSSAADFIGLGSNPLPNTPIFGIVQSSGFVLSILLILIGVILYIPANAGHSPSHAPIK
jgi:hypothetical protein